MGLMTFGTSAWTAIAERWQFCDRTTIDLKDKWRNLVRPDPRALACGDIAQACYRKIKAVLFSVLDDEGTVPG